MSKKRRTRKEKEIANLKKKLSKIDTRSQNPLPGIYPDKNIFDISEVSVSLKPKQIVRVQTNPAYANIKSAQKDYSYVISDMRYTAVVLLVILTVNLIIYYVSKNHILNISFIGI